MFKIKTVSNAMALKIIKCSEFFKNMMFIVPVLVVLYQDKGVSVGDVFLIQGLFALAGFLFEIPSGYLSDRFSRKKVLLFGIMLDFLAFVELYFAYGFWQIVLAEGLMGIAGALFSGTKEAYVYDLLKRDKKEKNFLREYGEIKTFVEIASFIGAIAGGTLYATMGDGLVALEAALIAVSVVCVAVLPELGEVKRRVSKKTSAWADVLKIVKMSIQHPEIKWFMIFPAVFSAFTLAIFWMIQPILMSVGVATALFGFYLGLNMFMRIVYAKFANRIYDRLGTRGMLALMMGALFVILGICLAVLHAHNMFVTYALCALIAIFPGVVTLAILVFNTLIHHRIKSSERGTVLSINEMYRKVAASSMMVLMKPLLDGPGLNTAIFVLLGLTILLIVPAYKVWQMKIK